MTIPRARLALLEAMIVRGDLCGAVRSRPMSVFAAILATKVDTDVVGGSGRVCALTEGFEQPHHRRIDAPGRVGLIQNGTRSGRFARGLVWIVAPTLTRRLRARPKSPSSTTQYQSLAALSMVGVAALGILP